MPIEFSSRGAICRDWLLWLGCIRIQPNVSYMRHGGEEAFFHNVLLAFFARLLSVFVLL